MSHTGPFLTVFLTTIAALAILAKRLGVPYPIVFVIGGLALALVPGVPTIELEPDLVFLLFLPTLIFSDGWSTDFRSFKRFYQPILLLAIGLVIVTSLGVAYLAHWMMGLPLALGFVLGAILSPTDAVATDAIAEDVGLPRTLATIAGGESLVNDATGLVIYKFAIAAVLTGAFSLLTATLQFVYVAVVGLAVGVGGAWLLTKITVWLRRRQLSDEVIAVAISLVTPFALYVGAERIGASGVLAAMAGGIYLSRKSLQIFDAESRIAAGGVWEFLVFVFNGAAFLLIGLQLRSILAGLHRSGYGTPLLIGWALAVAALVVAVRYAWMYPAAYGRRLIWPGVAAREGPAPSWQGLFVLSTAGMRGIVSLAAALALPLDFPQRDLILFVTFVVILVTLVGEGLALPVLIRRFGLDRLDDDGGRTVAIAHVRVAVAVRDHLRTLEPSFSAAEWEVAGRIQADYEQRAVHFGAHLDGSAEPAADEQQHGIERRLRREAYAAERRALTGLRAAGEIADDVFRDLQWDIDLAESRLE